MGRMVRGMAGARSSCAARLRPELRAGARKEAADLLARALHQVGDLLLGHLIDEGVHDHLRELIGEPREQLLASDARCAADGAV